MVVQDPASGTVGDLSQEFAFSTLFPEVLRFVHLLLLLLLLLSKVCCHYVCVWGLNISFSKTTRPHVEVISKVVYGLLVTCRCCSSMAAPSHSSHDVCVCATYHSLFPLRHSWSISSSSLLILFFQQNYTFLPIREIKPNSDSERRRFVGCPVAVSSRQSTS